MKKFCVLHPKFFKNFNFCHNFITRKRFTNEKSGNYFLEIIQILQYCTHMQQSLNTLLIHHYLISSIKPNCRLKSSRPLLMGPSPTINNFISSYYAELNFCMWMQRMLQFYYCKENSFIVQ